MSDELDAIDLTDIGEMNAMIEANLPLVKHIVLQVAVHFPRHVEREELARAGALGLVEAARRYDESRGVPFDRFAAQRIRGAILDAVRAADWAPRSVRTLARKLEAAEQRLASQLGRVPSIEEMAEALSMETNELNRLRDRMFRSVVLALEHEVSDDVDDDLTLVDVLVDQSAVLPYSSSVIVCQPHERCHLVRNRAPDVGQSRIGHLRHTLIGHTECQHCERRVTGKLQLRVRDLQVVLRFSQEKRLARAL